jgi:hypothetical protein
MLLMRIPTTSTCSPIRGLAIPNRQYSFGQPCHVIYAPSGDFCISLWSPSNHSLVVILSSQGS